MTGWRAVPAKQRRAFRRRNHIARDLYTPPFGPKIRESNKQHLIDELHEEDIKEELKEVDDIAFYWEDNAVDEHGVLMQLDDDYDVYHFHKDIGLASKE